MLTPSLVDPAGGPLSGKMELRQGGICPVVSHLCEHSGCSVRGGSPVGPVVSALIHRPSLSSFPLCPSNARLCGRWTSKGVTPSFPVTTEKNGCILVRGWCLGDAVGSRWMSQRLLCCFPGPCVKPASAHHVSAGRPEFRLDQVGLA